MAEVKNAFIKSKMNKDLDARLVPSGEYRNAINAQVSRSEGSDVGALENALGNMLLKDFEPSIANLKSIGYLSDESSGCIYLFLTDNTGSTYNVSPAVGSNHFIYKYDTTELNVSIAATKLVEGAFLNFSTLNPIYGVNLLENLLFFTDNKNQPRKINVVDAEQLNFYTTEDQISVAKYNPYRAIDLYEASIKYPGKNETTMKDVVSLTLPNGGSASYTGSNGSYTTLPLNSLSFKIYPNHPTTGMIVNKLNANGDLVSFNPVAKVQSWIDTVQNPTTVVLTNSISVVTGDKLVFSPNPYYNRLYNGDPRFLEDKFVRFSYRFKFNNGEYSIMAPFTQPCFIPKQDGYFLNDFQFLGDQQQAMDSTIVDFMENKVNEIGLIIPLPTTASSLASSLLVDSIDIIYKESNNVSIQIVESIPISDITAKGSDTFFDYSYQSQKPYKTLPSSEVIRVYDKTPVKALSQEIISNRVVYGNFQDKHTPPSFLNYNVSATEKAAFNLQTGTGVVTNTIVNQTTIALNNAVGDVIIGNIVTGFSSQVTAGVVRVLTSTGGNAPSITTNIAISAASGNVLSFKPLGPDQTTTSVIEYPNSSLKTNRNYQVGIVLSDKFGRQSTTILSNSEDTVTIGAQSYIGSTLFSPYIDSSINSSQWLGNSLKLLFNAPIPADPSLTDNSPGVYNGDVSSVNYNPLGWYSYKVVVKQTEQEYYNVYTAGAVKGSLLDPLTNLNTSFVTLINDNINKVPRDLSEVGPQDKTFRSSVILFGRVENNINASVPPLQFNTQYYPKAVSFTTSSVESLFSAFDITSTTLPLITSSTSPYSTFFKAQSNPFVAEIITSQTLGDQFGVTNILTVTGGTANVNGAVDDSVTVICNTLSGSVKPGSVVTWPNMPVFDSNVIVTEVAIPNVNLPLEPTITLNRKVTLNNGQPLVFTLTEYGKIKELAIFETKPVESRLDIFWETTTSGLVSDLNDMIITSENAAGGIAGFNDSNFTEAIQTNQNVSSTNFRLTDNLGSTVPPADVTSFILVSVFNREQTPQDVLNGNMGPYFELIETANNSRLFNVKVTTEFIQDIWFSQFNTTLAQFDFNFKAVVNGVETFYTRSATLKNVVPIITAPQGDSNQAFTVTTTRDTSLITTVSATNGAWLGNDNRNKNIDWIIPQANQVNSAGTTVSFFSANSRLDDTNKTSICEIVNNFTSTIPIDTYTITLICSDPGTVDSQVIITIKMEAVIEQGATSSVNGIFNYTINTNLNDEYEYFSYVILKVSDTNFNGFYLYYAQNAQNFFNSPTGLETLAEQSGSSTNININHTNALTGAACSTNSNTWYYASTDGGASGTLSQVRDKFFACITPQNGTDPFNEQTTLTQNEINAYNFGIV